jgi:carboxypeptidase PM20D1
VQEGGAADCVIPLITCSREQAERLGRAVRFRTVTLASGDPLTHPGYGEFRGFEEFLRREFPRAARGLKWENPGPLALLLTWEPADPGNTQPAVLLYAHYDVVPAGPDAGWSHPPFSGELADGFVWGRGTLDDKGALLAILEATEGLLTEGFQPRRTIYLAFGGDEETSGQFGAAAIAATLAERGVRLSCVLDEGSCISDGAMPFIRRPVALVGVAEKGFANVELVVEGRAGHSSTPGSGTSAGALAAVVAAIERQPFPARLTPTVQRFFRALAPHVGGLRGLGLRFPRPLWPLFRRRLSADPSMDALVRTTQAVTILRAGEKENVIPHQSRAVINLRLLPGDSSQSALARIERIARRTLSRPFSLTAAFLEGTTRSEPVPETRPDATLWKTIEESIREISPRAIVAPILVVVYTDSRKFVDLAACIVRLLPMVLGSPELARIHAFDERISLENYGRMIRFYGTFIRGTGSALT